MPSVTSGSQIKQAPLPRAGDVPPVVSPFLRILPLPIQCFTIAFRELGATHLEASGAITDLDRMAIYLTLPKAEAALAAPPPRLTLPTSEAAPPPKPSSAPPKHVSCYVPIAAPTPKPSRAPRGKRSRGSK